MKNKILKIVQAMLVAERNNNLKISDKYYHRLLSFCEQNNINFDNALKGIGV